MDFLPLMVQVMPKSAGNGNRALCEVMLAKKCLQIAACDYASSLGVEYGGGVALKDADAVA